MITYVNLGANDLAKARQFYTDLFAPMDVRAIYETPRGVFFGRSSAEPMLVICRPFNEEPATFGNGTMVALGVQSKAMVDVLHTKALELGGTCEGAPGYRIKDSFYAAYVRDLDGNKLAFTFRESR